MCAAVENEEQTEPVGTFFLGDTKTSDFPTVAAS